MSRTLMGVLAVLAVLGGVWIWSSTRAPQTPRIAITAPAGGEVWQAGETHAIAWTASGIPASDRIALTLRRIPPPPLPEEGQEFDPILFTDLPNTGSTTWSISPSYPGGTFVLGITAYESTPVTNPVRGESASFTIIHPKINIDAYPLYDGVAWQRSSAEQVVIGTTTYQGASISSFPVEDTMNPAGIFAPFEKYYDKLLKERGYTIANELAAGGHTGGQTGYRNGPQVILTRFSINYKVRPAEAPSECPCDVTLSVFSAVE